MLRLDPGQHPFKVGFHKGPRALIFRFFLTPDHFRVLEPFQFLHRGLRGEGIELFEPQDIDIVDPARIAFFQQVVIDLARTHDHALDLVVFHQLGFGIAILRIIPHHAVET